MIFADPDRLYLLAILLPLLGAWIGYELWYRRVRARIGDAAMIAAMTASVHPVRRRLARAMQLLGLILLVLGLARPQWGLTEEEVEADAIDVVFAVELSSNMLAEDVSPNRQAAVFSEIRDTMTNLGGDRVGLVLFTSISFVQAPLTRDYGTINYYLRRLQPGQIPVDGTSLGAALSDSIEVLRGRESEFVEGRSANRAQNQVVVLFTGSEDRFSSPTAAAEQARDLGIKVITVGIGGLDGARVPEYDARGQRRGYRTQDDGRVVIARQDQDTLQAMAMITGGEYIRFERPGQVVNQLGRLFAEMERAALEAQIEERYIDRSHLFLFPAFFLLLLSLFLDARRRKSGGKSWLSALLLLVALTAVGCESEVLDSQNEAASQAMAEGNYDEALQILDELLQERGDQPELHFNRGRALLGQEEFEEATLAFARALTTSNPSLRARTHYHMGLAMAGQERWRDAFESFTEGIEVLIAQDRAESDEELLEKLRHNLEVTLRELFPPCATLEDSLEPNSRYTEAHPLQEPTLENLTLCGGNHDFFAIPVQRNSRLKVSATLRELRDIPDPEQIFLPRSEGVQLLLYDSSGTEMIAIDQGLEDDEDTLIGQNRRRRVNRTIDDLLVTSNHLGNEEEGILFIALKASEGLEFRYDLEVEVIPTCAAQDDQFEPNPDARGAAELDPGNYNLHLCPDDEDWFSIAVGIGDSLFVDLQSFEDLERQRPPALSMELYRGDTGTLLARGHLDGPGQVTGLQNVDFSGQVHLRVFGESGDEQGPYEATIHHFEPCGESELDDLGRPLPRGHIIAEEERERRFFRRCDEAPDFIYVTPGEDRKVEWMLRALPTTAYQGVDLDGRTEPFGPFPEMELHLLHPERLTPFVSAEPVEQAENQELIALTKDQILQTRESFAEDRAILLVEGAPGFFHLRRLDDDSEQDQEDDQDDQDDQSEESEPEEDEENEDESPEEEDAQDEEESPSDEAEEEEEPFDEEEQDAEEEDSQEVVLSEEEELDIDPEHLEILRSLEEADDNFQLQRRLRTLPQQRSRQPW